MIEKPKRIHAPWSPPDEFVGDKRIRAFILDRLLDEGFPVRKYLDLNLKSDHKETWDQIRSVASMFLKCWRLRPTHQDPVPWVVLFVGNYRAMTIISEIIPMIFALTTHASVTRVTLPDLVTKAFDYSGSGTPQENLLKYRNCGMMTVTSFDQVSTRSDIAKANLQTLLGYRLDKKWPVFFVSVLKNLNKSNKDVKNHIRTKVGDSLGEHSADMILDFSFIRVFADKLKSVNV